MNTERLLVINAAEGLVQVLCAKRHSAAAPWSLLCFDQTPAASQGAEILAPRIQAVLKGLGLAPAQLTHLAAVRGPGSFTGLRLALATVAGLSRATQAVQAGLDYMPLLAMGAALLPGADSAGASLWPVTHARRDLVHVQGFSPAAPAHKAHKPASTPAAISDILVLSPAQALGMIALHAQKAGQSAFVFGSGLSRNRAFFEENVGHGVCLLEEAYDTPNAQALLALCDEAAFGRADSLPLYVRPSDAEANIEHIAATLRLDPLAARQRLEQLTGKLTV